MYKMNKCIERKLNLIINNVCDECKLSQLYKNIDNLKRTLINNFNELICEKFNINEIQKITIDNCLIYNCNDYEICYCESNNYYYDYNALIQIYFTIEFSIDNEKFENKCNAFFFIDNCNVIDFKTTMFDMIQNTCYVE